MTYVPRGQPGAYSCPAGHRGNSPARAGSRQSGRSRKASTTSAHSGVGLGRATMPLYASAVKVALSRARCSTVDRARARCLAVTTFQQSGVFGSASISGGRSGIHGRAHEHVGSSRRPARAPPCPTTSSERFSSYARALQSPWPWRYSSGRCSGLKVDVDESCARSRSRFLAAGCPRDESFNSRRARIEPRAGGQIREPRTDQEADHHRADHEHRLGGERQGCRGEGRIGRRSRS